MSGFELRPLSLGELLDRAFFLYRRNFWLFAGIMAIPAALFVPVRTLYLRINGLQIPWDRSAPQPHASAFAFGLIFANGIIYTMAQAATTHAVANVYLGRVATIRESYGKIRGHFWRIIGGSLKVGIRVFGLMFILVFGAAVAGGIASVSRGTTSALVSGFVIVGLILAAFALAIAFSMRYALWLPAALIEDMNAGASIRRSVLLTERHRGRIFLAILLGVLLIYALAALFQGPFYAAVAIAKMKGQLPVWIALTMAVSSAVGATVAGPLLMIILVLFYYDLRIRKEAFDLQQMMASLPEPNSAKSISRLDRRTMISRGP